MPVGRSRGRPKRRPAGGAAAEEKPQMGSDGAVEQFYGRVSGSSRAQQCFSAAAGDMDYGADTPAAPPLVVGTKRFPSEKKLKKNKKRNPFKKKPGARRAP